MLGELANPPDDATDESVAGLARAVQFLDPSLSSEAGSFVTRAVLLALMPRREKAKALVLGVSEEPRKDTAEVSKAIQKLNDALKLIPDFADAYFRRGMVRYTSGDVAGAQKDWEKVVELGQPGPLDFRALSNGYPASLYNLACVNAVRARDTPPGPERSKLLDAAFDHLSKAIEAGRGEVQSMDADPDLAALRSDSRYKELVKGLKPGS